MTTGDAAPTAAEASVDESSGDAPADPRGAVLVGVWAAGARCVLQYVLAPALGVLGSWLPWIGVLVQVAACVVTVSGAVQLHRSGRGRPAPWTAVACVVVVSTGWAVLSAFGA